jgi:hypothetical protein
MDQYLFHASGPRPEPDASASWNGFEALGIAYLSLRSIHVLQVIEDEKTLRLHVSEPPNYPLNLPFKACLSTKVKVFQPFSTMYEFKDHRMNPIAQ